jgi:hypothetical protein
MGIDVGGVLIQQRMVPFWQAIEQGCLPDLRRSSGDPAMASRVARHASR